MIDVIFFGCWLRDNLIVLLNGVKSLLVFLLPSKAVLVGVVEFRASLGRVAPCS